MCIRLVKFKSYKCIFCSLTRIESTFLESLLYILSYRFGICLNPMGLESHSLYLKKEAECSAGVRGLSSNLHLSFFLDLFRV